MEGFIKVNTQTLRNAASEFSNTSTQIRNTTSNLVTAVNMLTNSVWSGEAATAYITRFKGLDNDMTKIDRMIQEHVKDLNEMAAEYDRAEQENLNRSNSLISDIF